MPSFPTKLVVVCCICAFIGFSLGFMVRKSEDQDKPQNLTVISKPSSPALNPALNVASIFSDEHVKFIIARNKANDEMDAALLRAIPLGSTVTVGVSDISGCVISMDSCQYKVLLTTGDTVTLGSELLKLKESSKPQISMESKP